VTSYFKQYQEISKFDCVWFVHSAD